LGSVVIQRRLGSVAQITYCNEILRITVYFLTTLANEFELSIFYGSTYCIRVIRFE